MDDSVVISEKDRIAFDLMTIYCVIESLKRSEREVTADDVAAEASEKLSEDYPFPDRPCNDEGRYIVSDDVAKIAKVFSDRFERRKHPVVTGEYSPTGLLGYISKLILKYSADGKPFAKSLRGTQLSLEKYLKSDVELSSLTSAIILGYRDYLRENVSTDTASYYIRTLRTIIINAENEGLLPADFQWPAEIKTTVSRTSRSAEKSALTVADISRIEELDLSKDSELQLARDLFLFGYYAGGMELSDIANLTTSNLSGNILTYRRRQKGRERRLELSEKASAIVARYRVEGQPLLFPILQRRWKYLFTTAQAEIAASLKKIGNLLNLPYPLTFTANVTAARR